MLAISDDIPKRMAEHFLGRGSYWTRLHPPIKVLEVVPGNKELEAAKTIALMCRVGWRRVRGAAWCATELKSMPLPLARVLAQSPPRELPEEKAPGAYDYRGQALYVRETEEGYTARVTGPSRFATLAGAGGQDAGSGNRESCEASGGDMGGCATRWAR
jgi:hypothetical protein